jgi:hypothetical protein
MSKFRNGAVALGVAGAILGAAVPSIAAPVMSSTAALTQAASGGVEQVQWRGRGHWGGGYRHGGRGWAGAGVGFAAGALVGSAIASSNRGYYGGGYYGGYGGGYYDAPVYAAPAPIYVQPEVYAAPVQPGRCWINTDGDGRYGYWAAC